MSNGPGKIEIVKPFGEAFELMQKILFQPFDLKKWLVIGFAAFLSGHISGVNLPVGNLGGSHPLKQNIPSPDFEQWKPWFPIIIIVLVVVILALVVLFAWLRARGYFIFTDCIARNRAAIAVPWREYRREGNSYFLFLLLVGFGSLSLFGVSAFCAFGLGLVGHGANDSSMGPLLVGFLVIFLLVFLCFAFVFGVISFFMVPLMYVRRCRSGEAFRQIAGLILENAGSFILFCLFGFCLLLGVGMISGIAACLTCCLAALPYIGTVILLPVYVCLRGYGLFFIRQFGPDYDVFTAVGQSPLPPVAEPPIPPPLPS